MKKPTMLLLAALAFLAAASEPDWGVRLPLKLVPDGRIQRIELPARAILALRRGDAGDVRVLDADGRAQPMARLPAPDVPARRVALTPLPIMGAADALKVTGVTLRVDEGQARVVRVDGSPAGADGGRALLGVLLDTRRVASPARALALDVAAPANQPVTFTIESSEDLQNWTGEAERVLFRAGAGGPLVLPLHDVALRGRMLRVTWRAEGRLLSPVSVTGAALSLAGSADAVRLSVPATLPPLVDRHTASFALPLEIAPAAIGVVPADGSLPVSVKLFGRDDREQPWAEVGSGIAATRSSGGSQAIEIDRSYHEWQIVAASGGFDAAPAIELRFAPVAIAFLAAGKPPFSLVAGRADAESDALPMGTLARMAGDAGETMPDALVQAAPAAPLALPALATGASPRTWLLWGVLLVGVVALGAMAWVLARPRPAASGSGENT